MLRFYANKNNLRPSNHNQWILWTPSNIYVKMNYHKGRFGSEMSIKGIRVNLIKRESALKKERRAYVSGGVRSKNFSKGLITVNCYSPSSRPKTCEFWIFFDGKYLFFNWNCLLSLSLFIQIYYQKSMICIWTFGMC